MASLNPLATSSSGGLRISDGLSPSTTLVNPTTPSRIPLSPHPVGPRSQRRPVSISELTAVALESLSRQPKDLKNYLRTAQRSRDLGKEYARAHNYEGAFVEFAKAATIVLETLPQHKDYYVLLNESQRHNLGLNGQDILDNLSYIKPILVQRYEEWLAQQPQSDTSSSGPHTPQSYEEDPATSRRSHGTPFPIQEEEQYGPAREKVRGGRGYDDARGSSDEEARRREDAEATRRRQQDEYARRQQQEAARRLEEEQRARDTALQAPRERGPYGPRAPDVDAMAARMEAIRISDDREGLSPTQETRRRDEEANRRRLEDRRREEADGIVRRQQEAEAAARTARSQMDQPYIPPQLTSSRQIAHSQEQEGISRRLREAEAAARAARQDVSPTSYLPVSAPPNVISSAQQAAAMRDREEFARRQHEAEASARAARQTTPTTPSTLAAPTAVSSTQYQFLESHHREGVPIMPLESPSKYDDDSSTDASVNDGPSSRRPMRREKQRERSPSRPRRSPSYPIPVTTTSPPPPDMGAIRYPSLMTRHQMTQGYTPSLESMFAKTMQMPATSNLLFDTQASDPYSSVPRPSSSFGLGGVSYPQMPQPHHYHNHHHTHSHPSNGPSPSRPSAQPSPIGSTGSGSDRITRADSKSDGSVKELKTVILPRECLPRFLSIAAANTARNRETCGLLLGRDKGSKFVVSCLLVPRQHATSDTCTMDEEELVLAFQEERNLITLGWIHTHPTQSCFMSSVDLHTHCGFQRMLPESFAVVCAPTSKPNFGIFRLTDPPGLQTILDCQAKEAFHPHPDLPIYTDADKGHVQMKDTSLEIVDLR